MSERDDNSEYPWLSEFLCEYVDGTMEPGARVMFEECLRGNPELAAYIARLQCARKVLGHYGCRLHAPCNLHEKLHQRLAEEQQMVTEMPPPAALTARLNTSAMLFSALLIMMLGGATVGSFLPGLRPDTTRADLPGAARTQFVPTLTTAGVGALRPIPAFYVEEQSPLLPDTLPYSPKARRLQSAH